MNTTNTIGSGTVLGALEYLDFLSNKGHVSPGAVTALRTGFSKVMETVGGNDWKQVDIRTIDLDEHMIRFGNMTHGRYNSKSLLDYKSRTKKVLSWYTEFLKTPGWTPPIKTRVRSQSDAKNAEKQHYGQDSKSSSLEISRIPTDSPVLAAKPLERSNLVAFPFPLSDGTLASLYLPTIIGASDAKRMSRFIETLVIDGINNGS